MPHPSVILRLPPGWRAILCSALLLAPAATPSQDSLQTAYQRAVSRLSSPELEERVAHRRRLQQQGYAAILHEALAGDGLAALMEWTRMMLQLEYSIDAYPLFLYVHGPDTPRDTSLAGRFLPPPRAPVPIPLVEDRSFPRNPWAPRAQKGKP